MSIEAMKLFVAEMEYVLSCINAHKVPFDGDDFHEALRLGRQAIEQAQKPITWVSKEQLLQDWLPRLWDALKDVRHKENAAAEETLYELYVEMKQETIAEKLDTMSEITPEDQLSAVIAELQATQKRLADTENILCRQHFEQKPAAWIIHDRVAPDRLSFVEVKESLQTEVTPLYTSPPQRQPLSDEQRREIAFRWRDGNGTASEIIDMIEAAHGIKGKA